MSGVSNSVGGRTPVGARSGGASGSVVTRPAAASAPPPRTASTASRRSRDTGGWCHARSGRRGRRLWWRGVRVPEPTALRLGRREFGPHALVVMAIVNRTPDSFFDQGAFQEDDAALQAVERAVDEGA